MLLQRTGFFPVFIGCCFSGQHWGCKDKTGWRTKDDVHEGIGLSVPEGTEGLRVRQLLAFTQKVGHCRVNFALNEHVIYVIIEYKV